MKNINKQMGFTLIELVMVIVILGVLSAFALPRFADLGSNARSASMNGLTASLRSAASISHAQWLVSGDATAITVSLDNTSVAMINGYPTTAAGGISAAAQISTDDYSVVVAADNTTVTYSVSGATTPASCVVVYTAATSSSSSSVAQTVSGC